MSWLVAFGWVVGPLVPLALGYWVGYGDGKRAGYRQGRRER